MVSASPFEVVWGKSRGGTSLLLVHLLDTAAVAELIWDSYLAPTVRRQLDECADGQGRSLFCLLAGLHDVGKATPAFQAKVAALARRVQDAGYSWCPLMSGRRWHHTLAGAKIVKSVVRDKDSAKWLWPIIAGHHGCVPGAGELRSGFDAEAHGTGAWPAVQEAFVERVAAELEVDIDRLSRTRRPARAVQLTLSGLVVMADWIASDQTNFVGIETLADVSMGHARQRAKKAWQKLGLRGGWQPSALSDEPASLLTMRFDKTPRSFQLDVVAAAEKMVTPGLLIVEAPMGEGKTEAALAAAEVLARRFEADGVFVGMPTQATSDPMFSRIRKWVARIDPDVPVALLHGRSRFNPEWAKLRRTTRFGDVSGDEYGMGDPYTETAPDSCCTMDARAVAEWFLGNKRGLLSPIAIGTVDHLLYAATRTRHVMLRHAGLAGRVVILDEVHAYDVYMTQFLNEALRWLAEARVPVILLSATLSPAQRADLLHAYAQGTTKDCYVSMDIPSASGYPRTTALTSSEGRVDVAVTASEPWQAARRVQVDLLPEREDFDPAELANAVLDTVRYGGRALVVCNTVDRAQAVYRLIREELGKDAALLHARLTATARAERTDRLVNCLGPDVERPDRMVIVATQVAEQSFDIDVDVLFSDLAPIDLLLQRIGRMHRHHRPIDDRPTSMQSPRVVVSGVRFTADGPAFPRGSIAVYGEHLLLRAAALIDDAQAGWVVPAQVPDLVAKAYGGQPLGPDDWQDRMARAKDKDTEKSTERTYKAQQFLLAGEDELGTETLAGLHQRRTAEADDDEVAAVVRDGDESIEVVLVRRDTRGYLTLGGRRMGPNGEGVSDDAVLEEAAGSVVRLPARATITAAAKKELTPLPGWTLDPWLSRTRALELPARRGVELGGHVLTYDDDLGLIVQRNR